MSIDHDQGAAASPLGKPVAYRDIYSPELLFPIDRQGKRAEIGIEPGRLPFVGEDLWNAYELSWLDSRGKPVVALGRFRVPADSPRLIESKSLKLYLNSFNQQRFGELDAVHETLARDLGSAAGAPVGVALQSLAQWPQRRMAACGDALLLDELELDIDTYLPEPRFLEAGPAGDEVTETLCSHLLKSNCLVTGQPDWGSVYVRYTGARISREGLLRYIVSFRQHNEFHEQCVERMFCDIQRRCTPRHLAVWARYTRRGGLDINPFRSSGHFPAPEEAWDIRQ